MEAPGTSKTAPIARHFGMDWLRIAAFGLLILYHIGMVFVPWGFHVKAPEPVAWATLPMLALNPWRLTLLFLVSGYAMRAMLARDPAPGRFLRERTARLVPPLLFGVAVIVPPQSWVELVTQHGYARDYWTFWTRDYFRLGTLNDIILPTWNHLWFVGYLWLYVLGLVLIVLLPGGERAQRLFDRVFAGTRVLWLPATYLLVTQVIVFQRWTDHHDVVSDGVAHLAFFPAVLFGFGLAGSVPVMAWLKRLWLPAAILAAASCSVAIAIEIVYADTRLPWAVGRTMLAARQIQCWMTIAALIGLADRFLNRDHPARTTLAEAVFPFYLVHQTILIVAMYGLIRADAPNFVSFPLLIIATAGGCWLFYVMGRDISWLRPLIGLKPALASRTGSAREVATA